MKLMGVLNVTPDSFSDGGKWFAPADAIEHGMRLWRQGANIVDVGAESTRPGSTRISANQEWDRLKDVIPELTAAGIVVSVDTVHASTAALAVEAGASYVNDISGGSHDPEMNRVVASADVRYIIQHWRGFPGSADLDLRYANPAQDTLNETLLQVERALESGVKKELIIIDPGLGFALTGPQSWQIVDNLKTWTQAPYPVLVGASRKRFIRERFPDRVEEGTLLVSEKCARAGVWGIRVHDVAGNRVVSA